jgi:hypothetical protein
MARKMRKFSEGGAQGKYDRRMADIEKDFKKGSAGKSGKALEVLEAKRAQRKADAEDDRAKRTGADRTATRAAEKAAESNLTKTRKYGAAKSVVKDPGPVANVTDSLATPKMDVSIGAKPAVKKPAAKAPVQKAADTKPKRMGDQGFAYKKKDMATIGDGVSTHRRYVRGGSNSGAAADGTAAKRLEAKGLKTEDLKTGKTAPATGGTLARGKPGAPLISGTDTRAFFTYGDAAAKKNAANKAKGGKIMKYAKGGSTPPQPNAAERKAGAKFRESIKDIKPTPAQGKILDKTGKKFAAGGVTKEMPSSKAMGSMNMAKGGKAKAKAKGKGNPFAATKFGAAMMKKGADAKGRAMPKFAKGGSIDGCAQRGKTKMKRVTMKKGGSC